MSRRCLRLLRGINACSASYISYLTISLPVARPPLVVFRIFVGDLANIDWERAIFLRAITFGWLPTPPPDQRYTQPPSPKNGEGFPAAALPNYLKMDFQLAPTLSLVKGEGG